MQFQVYINNVDYTQYVSLPLSDQLALDRSLDYGSLKLSYTDIQEAIKPFTEVVITFIADDSSVDELFYFVANDKCEEIIQTETYNHTLMLIEQTKALERFVGRTHPITQKLLNQLKVVATVSKTGALDWKKALTFKSPMAEGVIYIDGHKKFFNEVIGVTPSEIGGVLNVYKDGETVFTDTGLENNEILLNVTEGRYYFEYWSGAFNDANTTRVMFYIDVWKEEDLPKPKTITSEVNNVLATIETLWVNETPRFVFNEEQAKKYENTVIPEITLTGTLYEQLNQIGQCINAVPRLKKNVVYFDEWGNDELIEQNPYLQEYISSVKTFDIEQYAVALDSNVDNFVNNDATNEGSIVEPYTDGFKTVRTESAVGQLTEDNVVISTQYPIERILNVQVGFANSSTFVGYDISNYVYSLAEYNTLSSFQDVYPSKSFAIYYDVGQKDIKGLSFKVPNIVNPIFENYAIVNIINRALSEYGQSQVTIDNILQLQFRVTYIPIINGRARQYRQNIAEVPFASTLTYNQSSQKINAKAMGKAMKGAIEKLGNPELIKTYLISIEEFKNVKDIKIGQKFNEDYYISIIKREYYPEFVKMELGLSKNFNKLSEYVGVDNEIRFYEISEKQVVNSQILYEEFCVIGDDLENYDNNIAVSLDSISKSLRNKPITKISGVLATGFADGVELKKVVLPVVTYAMGNSVLMSFSYEDNFTAGSMVKRGITTYQKYVEYTDVWGEVHELMLEYGQYKKLGEYNYNDVVKEADAIPDASEIDAFEFTKNMNLNVIINKENRAIPTFNYMLHFVTNRKDIVIGEGMAKYCYINNTEKGIISLYVFDKPLKKFDDELTGGTQVGQLDGTFISQSRYIKFDDIKTQVAGKSWALIKEVNGSKHLLFGQNIDLKANDTINLPKLNFTHILY